MRRILFIILGIVVILIVASGIGFFLFSQTAGPSEDITASTTRLSVPDAAAGDAAVFRIVQEDSQVAFTLSETLRGQDVTVVGTTNQVDGDILVNVADPSQSQIGEIRINARTLQTDNPQRNVAIQRFILEAGQPENEFIVFQPTQIAGMPETVTVGEVLTFQVTGDLTVSRTTNQAVFDANVTPVSVERLEGTAETTVRYAAYGLEIPAAPGVANVSDDVVLSIDFAATLSEGELSLGGE